MGEREFLRALIFKVLETNSIRELLDKTQLKAAKKNVPDIVLQLLNTYTQNQHRFETQHVNPLEIHLVRQAYESTASCDSSELARLAGVALFIMEREIHEITKRILDGQS